MRVRKDQRCSDKKYSDKNVEKIMECISLAKKEDNQQEENQMDLKSWQKDWEEMKVQMVKIVSNSIVVAREPQQKKKIEQLGGS